MTTKLLNPKQLSKASEQRSLSSATNFLKKVYDLWAHPCIDHQKITVDRKKNSFLRRLQSSSHQRRLTNKTWIIMNIWNRMTFIFCPRMKNNLTKSKNLQRLMTENQIRVQNQIARIANHSLIDVTPRIFTKEIAVYEKKFISLKPLMCNQTLQEII